MADSIASQMRSFNRFYTEAIGSLDANHEGLAVSLAQSRILFTVAAQDHPDVGRIAEILRLDLAYTSRLLGALEDGGLVERSVGANDRRRRVVALTAEGRRTLDEIERRSNARMHALVAHLDEPERARLVAAMDTIRELLDKETIDDDPG